MHHAGYWFHTIGQRKGIPLHGGPWYAASCRTGSFRLPWCTSDCVEGGGVKAVSHSMYNSCFCCADPGTSCVRTSTRMPCTLLAHTVSWHINVTVSGAPPSHQTCLWAAAITAMNPTVSMSPTATRHGCFNCKVCCCMLLGCMRSLTDFSIVSCDHQSLPRNILRPTTSLQQHCDLLCCMREIQSKARSAAHLLGKVCDADVDPLAG